MIYSVFADEDANAEYCAAVILTILFITALEVYISPAFVITLPLKLPLTTDIEPVTPNEPVINAEPV